MHTQNKEPIKIWLTNLERKQLEVKAQEHFTGKGFLSHYLCKIAQAKAIIILEGTGKVKISLE